MHGRDHALVLLRTSDREHSWVTGGDLLRLGAHAAGHDQLAVLVERLADGGERFRLGAVEKAAGVDDREVGTGMGTNEFIALRAQARDDAHAVDQRLRAAERDKAHSRRAWHLRRGMSIFHVRGLPERVAGSKPARPAGGVHIKRSARGHRLRITSLNIHDFSLYRGCCSRPSFRPGMYRWWGGAGG